MMFWLFVLLVQSVFSDPLVVDTPQGQIRGLPADDGDYSMFLGIPFGQVDANNPFGAAQPYPKFNGTFEANDDSAVCPQTEELTNIITGTLDCLNLNVYVPNNSSEKTPVLVWIHGGGFSYGDGSKQLQGPKYLVRHGIIVVSINYRLGPYGFLCLDIPEVSGNQGLKDQVLALRWIRNNIESFGGDVNKITAYGESAGAASVEFHLASENEKLFQQAILSSGAIFGEWTISNMDNSVPLKLAAELGFDTDNVRDALDHLKNIDVVRVIEAARQFGMMSGCIENKFNGVEGFLHVHPFSLNILPKADNTPIITGYNSDEMLISYANTPEESFPNLDPFRNFARGLPDEEEVYNLFRRFYIGDVPITSNVRRELTDFNSDYTFNHASHRSLNRFLDSGSKVYYYIFSYSGGRNLVKVRTNVTVGGAAHADELGYVFDMGSLSGLGEANDYLVLDRMTMLWANFVKYGNPTPEVTPLLPVIWPVATQQTNTYLDIDSNLEIGSRPFHARLTFWDLFHIAYPFESNDAINNVTPKLLLVVTYSIWKLIS